MKAKISNNLVIVNGRSISARSLKTIEVVKTEYGTPIIKGTVGINNIPFTIFGGIPFGYTSKSFVGEIDDLVITETSPIKVLNQILNNWR